MFDNHKIGNVHVLTPRKNLVGGDETTTLIGAVADLAAAGESRVVLDLQRISWVSSLGIEGLRRIHRLCQASGGWLRLAGAGARIRNVLLTMRLDWIFETFDTTEEALAARVRTSMTTPVDPAAAPTRAMTSN
jgi:anti-anti-sigma factor